MVIHEFSGDDIARFRQKALSEPEVMDLVVARLREIAMLEGHSYGAVRLAREALRALGAADVPLSRSEILRLKQAKDNGGVSRSLSGDRQPSLSGKQRLSAVQGAGPRVGGGGRLPPR